MLDNIELLLETNLKTI